MLRDDFEQWFKQTIGLDAATVGRSTIERAVTSRMAAGGHSDMAAYWHFAQSSPAERQELIEAVIVPETWFFRDTDAFAALTAFYDAQWAAAHLNASLRLLSLPCSSGEEPYSLAMALLDAGVPAERMSIDAIDISERSLAKAARGRYGHYSFRGRDLRFRDRHFEPAGNGHWQLSEKVRKQVQFRWSNVMDIGALPGEAIYDVIFCRNLLIYFDQDTQLRTIDVLSRLLQPHGLIFVGPAESGLMLHLGFASVQMPMAFAFRKARAKSVRPIEPSPPLPALRPVVARPSASKPPAIPATAAPNPLPISANKSPLHMAQELADSGRFAAAAQACEALLKLHGSTAEALQLLGLIRGATGESAQAEHCFRKVLYLQPDHEDALMHLALLLENKGDLHSGRLLRLRAERHRGTAG
jgi:chemotaxis protein methyltransferase WspC